MRVKVRRRVRMVSTARLICFMRSLLVAPRVYAWVAGLVLLVAGCYI